MSPLGFAAVFLLLLAMGAHVLVPLRAVRKGSATAREVWGLAALPLLLTACLLSLWRLSGQPKLLLDAGWGSPGLLALGALALAFLLPTLMLMDLVLAMGRRKMEPVGFRLAGFFALLPLAATQAIEEILARGDGAAWSLGLLLAALWRVLVALGAAEAVAPTPGSDRPFWTVPAALGLLAWPFAAPRELFASFLDSGLLAPLGAAALLFLAARWIPARLRRPAILAATLLACLVFTWTAVPEPEMEPETLELEPMTLPAP